MMEINKQFKVGDIVRFPHGFADIPASIEGIIEDIGNSPIGKTHQVKFKLKDGIRKVITAASELELVATVDDIVRVFNDKGNSSYYDCLLLGTPKDLSGLVQVGKSDRTIGHFRREDFELVSRKGYELTIIEKARLFARTKHHGQFRRDGITPYFTHCEKVVSLVDTDEEKAVAYLHDTVEDGRCNINEIELVFGEQIKGYINVLTKIKDWTYERYIERFNYPANGRMKLIKIADIVSNLSDNPTQKQIEKYNKALRILSGV